MNKYSFNIEWSEESGEYMATCPAFPGLSAFGETEEEALAEAKVALELFLESYRERGLSLPLPDPAQDYSGQFRVRLSKQDHRRAAQMAAKQNISLNQFVGNAVAAALGAGDLHERFTCEMRQMIQEMEQRLVSQTTQHGWKLAASVADLLDRTFTPPQGSGLAPPPSYHNFQLNVNALRTSETPSSFADLLYQIQKQQEM